MKAQIEAELRSIIDKQLESLALTTAEAARLEVLLQDEQSMEHYLKSMELHAYLPECIEDLELRNMVNRGETAARSLNWLALAATFATIIAFAAGWYIAHPKTPENPLSQRAPDLAFDEAAKILDTFGVLWTEGFEGIGQSRDIMIDSGLVELLHSSGVRVVIEGPAHYSITGRNRALLNYGRCVATVPNGAEGFTVDYPNGKIIDLGTEFAMEVSPDGSLQVGVFKGKVALQPNNSTHASLVEEAHAVRQGAAESEAVTSIPFERNKFVRSLPSRELPWSLDSESATTMNFDVTHLIYQQGEYRAVIKWMTGGNAISISQASLWLDGELISEDVHPGASGLLNKTVANIYNFTIDEGSFHTGQWTLKITCAPINLHDLAPIECHGVVLLEEGLAYHARPADFIGCWQYTHDGSVWQRQVLEDGTIELYENGLLKQGFQASHWSVENGVMKVWIPHLNAFEAHLLRDPATMIFVNRPYRNAMRQR